MQHRNLQFALSIVLVLAIALLAVPMSARAQDPVTITFWNGFTGPDRPTLEALVAEFNETHTDIQVEMTITPWDSLYQTLLSAMSAGEGPDFVGFNYNYVPQYAESGLIMDISDWFEEGSNLDLANWPATLVDLLQYNDKFYAVPMNYATLMMYYNLDIFEEVGLDPENPPADWDTWVEALRTITAAGYYGIAFGERETIPNWPILLWGNGADVIVDGESGLNTPEAIEALELWGGLVRDEGISPYGLTGAEADQLFQSGRAAMGITGPWMVNGFLEAGVNMDVAPIPAGPAGPVTLSDSVVFVVNNATENAEEVKAFLDFWNSYDAQITWSAGTGFPPARLDLSDSPDLFEANPWAAKFASLVPVSRFYMGGQKNYTQIDNDIFVPMIQSITQGVASVEEAAAAADAQLTALLAQSE
jgi:multiple sugar transport system substrate-binding protein